MAQQHPMTPRGQGDADAPHYSPVTPAEDMRSVLINRISWGAVLAGVVVSLVAHLLLSMLGIGVGFGTLDPRTGDNPSVQAFSIGAAAWWTISGIIAALVGGFVAGRLSGRPKESTAGWHGVTAWAATTLVIMYMLTTAVGSVIGGAFSVMNNTLSSVASTAQSAVPALTNTTDPFAAIEQQIRGVTGGNDPAALRDAAVASVRALVTGNQAQAQAAREQAAQALARAQNIPLDQARTRVAELEQQYRQSAEQVRQQAASAAETGATAISTTAILAVVALLLGALAGWFGGRWGAVDPTITDAELAYGQRRI